MYLVGLILVLFGGYMLNLHGYFMYQENITTNITHMVIGLAGVVFGMMAFCYALSRPPKPKPLGFGSERGSASAAVALVFGLVGWVIILLLVGCYLVNQGIMLPRGW
jgi:hypothetical protein